MYIVLGELKKLKVWNASMVEIIRCLFSRLLQNLALFGALLFYIDMKNPTPRRQLKKKAPKAKAT